MPFRRAACWGSARRAPLWPRMDAVGGPKNGLRAFCCDHRESKGCLFHGAQRDWGVTYGDFNSFVITAADCTSGPVVETSD